MYSLDDLPVSSKLFVDFFKNAMIAEILSDNNFKYVVEKTPRSWVIHVDGFDFKIGIPFRIDKNTRPFIKIYPEQISTIKDINSFEKELKENYIILRKVNGNKTLNVKHHWHLLFLNDDGFYTFYCIWEKYKQY